MEFEEAIGEALAYDIRVYIRPVLSDKVKGEKPGYIYWIAQAEHYHRNEWRTWQAEGYDMEDVAVEAIEQALKATGHMGPPKKKGKK